ncbi:hypothetical protein Salat_0435800 [Sesamum alatum]|uniref:TF-B3 domain-containing protein n=1 Tax=Sesamum alatum TaxID=300844 RepID=A0AAE1Z3A4_9LAMI|nr:hypothetical protein Salat_0435800 [Sesamum alatum]
MGKSIATSGPSRKDKGKAKVGIEDEDQYLRISEDDDQETTAASQEKGQGADDSAVVLPFKKRWAADEANDVEEGTPPEKSSTDQPSDTRPEAELEEDDEEAPDDQTVRNLKPGSRDLKDDEYCLSTTLSRFEVIPHNPQLYLDVEDTSILLNWPELVDFLRVPFTLTLLVFDGNDRRYDMLLKQQVSGGRVKYAISAGWGEFVRIHNLKAGDELTIYRIFDTRVCDVYYYVLRYFRKPMDRQPYIRRNKSIPGDIGQKLLLKDKENGPEQVEPKVDRNQPEGGRVVGDQVPVEKIQPDSAKVEGDQVPVENTSDQTERKAQGPGSRVLTSEEYCMEKTLTAYEVIPENAKLYLDALDASELTAFPEIVNYPLGTYSKTLLVYDEDDGRYDMLLKHHVGRGVIGYAVSSGWDGFVRTHDLKAGDVVTFYRVLDESVSDDYYHIVRFTRKSGHTGTREKTVGDGEKDQEPRYKLEGRRKEDGGLVIKMAYK